MLNAVNNQSAMFDEGKIYSENNGLFTLHGNGTSTSTGKRYNRKQWVMFLSLSQTSVNISTWFYTLHVQYPRSVSYDNGLFTRTVSVSVTIKV